MAQFLRIREWQRFQHYKDRDPPWIKLHRELLTSRTWVSLDDASRVLAVALMLLAAGTDNHIPSDPEYLKRVAYLNSEPDWMPLVRTQFVELVDENGNAIAPASTVLAKRTECSSEESRGEAEKRRAEQKPVPQERDVGPVDRVFEHWRSEYGHRKAVLDPKRRRVIQAALKAYDEPTLCQSISGFRNSSHHMGENERRTIYDDIELFLRDSKHIEDGLRFARGPPAPAMSAVEQARQKLRQSVNGNGRVVSEQPSQSEGGLGQTAGFLR